MSAIVKVHDMRTFTDHMTYVGLTPRQAVIAAYAQSIGDNGTWEYEKRYSDKVYEGRVSVACGDFAARKTNG